MKKMIIEINGQVLPKEKIDEWELVRLKKEYKFLTKNGFKFNDQFLVDVQNKDVDKARIELAKLKASYDPETFRTLLKRKYTLGNLASKVAVPLSRRRKYSMTEFVIPNSDKSPEEVMTAIETIMLENTSEHLYLNLATNPDHFVLISTAENIQEVVEITGGSPFPNRFFAHYGDETGLTSKLGDGFTIQAAGAAKLEDGTIIGGVRHQIKREGNGLRFRALVEFPSILPNYMIQKHQYHLACEFRQWLSYVI
ncbi:hypothetical protein [Candidatus Enterococcus courvalinii]|uniref:Uncharacterized protein n=1 Tax=Candidatus Enterococcus courvalinii TaxID=2815329 RepID=A0ABS3HW98_9ENTE|nr:hypothetical protein [Enterococcus sp. MSG2901]MBO0480744.1 hypothetical protein [Enterococcus sp. MSG2901]